MGIQEYDFLYEQAQIMKGYFSTISTNLNNMSLALDSAIESINTSDTESAISTISSTKSAIIEANGVLVQATEMVNSLVPLITAEVSKYYDGKTRYIYECKECSIPCVLPLWYVPLDKKVLKTCLLKGDNSASFYQAGIETVNP